MLEARSAYGYFGVADGVTGETPPDDRIEKQMPYWEYKNRYSECDTLHDYDKVTKTITVLLPKEYAERPNFGNRYSMHEFRFVYAPKSPGYSDVAKCYENALRKAKAWARRKGKRIIGDEPGREFQRNW